ncbi:hypothetical protein FisN_2Lh438 [Fistulifera solaris]|uniref:Photosystem II 12 kDa extrinsic protein n=1 Tax=Fistulifera solaris TaxID=1519565 RepID=A0A1Z5JPY9_FISSO|nr:hypothetical protein FisN_2Lh438 [Fistulifera solaris]|eukprot:GAX15841.1 hypothetical protein FisN_2Lh438 [Fistulifera solaris]
MKIVLPIFALFFVMNAAQAFTAHLTRRPTDTSLDMERREFHEAILSIVAGVLAVPTVASAKPASTFFFDDELVQEPAQQNTGGKVDVNAAFVGDYMQFPGMFPHAAGKIASNGPYKTVKDIYKIEGLTDHDIAMFKKYQSELTANPPGRVFTERINARVST